MKKVKAILCTLVLSVSLVGNVFAGNSLRYEVFSFFENVVELVLSLTSNDCKPRQCNTCRPEDIRNGNCRPTEG